MGWFSACSRLLDSGISKREIKHFWKCFSGCFLKVICIELGGVVRKTHAVVGWIDIIQWVQGPERTKGRRESISPSCLLELGHLSSTFRLQNSFISRLQTPRFIAAAFVFLSLMAITAQDFLASINTSFVINPCAHISYWSCVSENPNTAKFLL